MIVFKLFRHQRRPGCIIIIRHHRYTRHSGYDCVFRFNSLGSEFESYPGCSYTSFPRGELDGAWNRQLTSILCQCLRCLEVSLPLNALLALWLWTQRLNSLCFTSVRTIDRCVCSVGHNCLLLLLLLSSSSSGSGGHLYGSKKCITLLSNRKFLLHSFASCLTRVTIDALINLNSECVFSLIEVTKQREMSHAVSISLQPTAVTRLWFWLPCSVGGSISVDSEHLYDHSVCWRVMH